MTSTAAASSILALSALLLLAGGAAAATIRVPGDHATIQLAVDNADAGDTILVGPGTYPEYVLASGLSNLTLKGKKAVISGPIKGGLAPVNGQALLTIDGCPGIAVSGFTFVESTTGAIAVMNTSDADLSRCVIEGGTGDAIRLYDNDGVRISRCTFRAPGGSGIVDDSTRDLRIEKCRIEDPSGDGIRLSAFSEPGNFSDRAEVTGNTVSGAVFGIVVRGTASVIERNSLVECRHFGIQLLSGGPGQGGTIAKNRIRPNLDFAQGIWSEQDGAVVSKNVVDGIMTNGIQATGSGVTVDGNRISGSVNGIMVGGSGITVLKNTVKDAGQYAFALYGSVLSVTGNVAQGSEGNGFDVFCFGSTLSGNRASGITGIAFYVEATGNTFSKNSAKGSGVYDLADRNASGANTYATGNRFGTSQYDYLPIE